jgi:hypothetical protein
LNDGEIAYLRDYMAPVRLARGVPPIDPAMLAKINGGDAWDDDAAADRALNPFIGWTIALGLGTLVWALVFFVVTL